MTCDKLQPRLVNNDVCTVVHRANYTITHQFAT